MKIKKSEKVRVLAHPQPKKVTPANKQKETQTNSTKYQQSNLMNQRQVVLEALQEGDKTTHDFIVNYNILGPAARMHELRKIYIIKTIRLSSGMALYRLEGKIDV